MKLKLKIGEEVEERLSDPQVLNKASTSHQEPYRSPLIQLDQEDLLRRSIKTSSIGAMINLLRAYSRSLKMT